MTLSGLAFLAVALLVQEKELLYDGPKDATPGLLQKAAKSLAARCEASGVKDVTAAPTLPDAKGNKRIRLTRPLGFSEEDRDRIDALASFPGSKVELRFIHELGAADKEKYPMGQEAPPGDSWVKLRSWERVESPFETFTAGEGTLQWLLKDKPILDASGKVTVLKHAGGRYKGKDLGAGTYLEFPREIARPIYTNITKDADEPNKDVLLIALLIDGHFMETGGGVMGWIVTSSEKEPKFPDIAVWKIRVMEESKVLPLLLKHPLPFALDRVE